MLAEIREIRTKTIAHSHFAISESLFCFILFILCIKISFTNSKRNIQNEELKYMADMLVASLEKYDFFLQFLSCSAKNS